MPRGKLLEYAIHPPAAPAPPSPKKTHVMVLAHVMMLALVMVGVFFQFMVLGYCPLLCYHMLCAMVLAHVMVSACTVV